MNSLENCNRARAATLNVAARSGQMDWRAVAVGALVLLAAGLGHRALAWRLGRAPEHVPIAPGTLRQLPLEIGDWSGTDEPVDPAIVQAADVDDYVNRRYVHARRGWTVRLWIAFGVRARDLMPHRPEVCYPGAGWTLDGKEVTNLPLGNGTTLRANILTFSPGALDPRRLTVLNYYVIDGQMCEDVSLLRSRAWRGQTSVRYVAQIQITGQAGSVAATACPRDALQDFAVETAHLIRGLLNEATAVGPREPAPDGV